MLQTVGGSGSIQVAQPGNTQQLQQIQVVPASGIQVRHFVGIVVRVLSDGNRLDNFRLTISSDFGQRLDECFIVKHRR